MAGKKPFLRRFIPIARQPTRAMILIITPFGGFLNPFFRLRPEAAGPYAIASGQGQKTKKRARGFLARAAAQLELVNFCFVCWIFCWSACSVWYQPLEDIFI